MYDVYDTIEVRLFHSQTIKCITHRSTAINLFTSSTVIYEHTLLPIIIVQISRWYFMTYACLSAAVYRFVYESECVAQIAAGVGAAYVLHQIAVDNNERNCVQTGSTAALTMRVRALLPCTRWWRNLLYFIIEGVYHRGLHEQYSIIARIPYLQLNIDQTFAFSNHIHEHKQKMKIGFGVAISCANLITADTIYNNNAESEVNMAVLVCDAIGRRYGAYDPPPSAPEFPLHHWRVAMDNSPQHPNFPLATQIPLHLITTFTRAPFITTFEKSTGSSVTLLISNTFLVSS
jgi:hypothetical protein